MGLRSLTSLSLHPSSQVSYSSEASVSLHGLRFCSKSTGWLHSSCGRESFGDTIAGSAPSACVYHIEQCFAACRGSRPLGLELEVRGVEGYDVDSETLIPTDKVSLSVTIRVALDAEGPSVDAGSGQTCVPRSVAESRGLHGPPLANARKIQTVTQGAMAGLWVVIVGIRLFAPSRLHEDEFQHVGVLVSYDEDGSHDERSLLSGVCWNTWTFQRVTAKRALFVARHESVTDFLVRSEILLKPLVMELYPILAEAQALADRLAFVLTPSWWQQYNLHALLVASAASNEPAFVTVVRVTAQLAICCCLHPGIRIKRLMFTWLVRVKKRRTWLLLVTFFSCRQWEVYLAGEGEEPCLRAI